jgi:hypothetical protein
MSTSQRVIGMPSGIADIPRRDIRFELALNAGRSLPLVARFGVAEQIIAALAVLLADLRHALIDEGATEALAAQAVESAMVQKDPFSDRVILHLLTPQGVPYVFGIPAQNAADIADQLRTAGAQATARPGHA